jgi:DNA-binding response OmpR family regulator
MAVEVLVVEDDPKLRAIISATAAIGGFQVREVGSGHQAISLVSHGVGDVILLDLGLPDYDGRELLIVLRQISNRPILVVSGRSSERDRIEALDLGADDFIAKPFLPGELLARIRASLRRYGTAETGNQSGTGIDTTERLPARVGPFLIDPFDHSVTFNGAKIQLSGAEYRIFRSLAAASPSPVNRQELLEQIRGESAPPSAKIIDVYVSRIRSKLRALPGGGDIIVSVPGRGWSLLPPPRHPVEPYAESE